ncbi:MAG: hypothetical protein IIZ78_28490 [Clostridiales bacterium]|nr:hypothetical protein [Clostridiales bacterium]
MTINIQLSTESIAQAIRTLEQAKDNLQLGLEETVDILTKEGEWTAKASIGEMAHVDSVAVDNQGLIEVSGEAAVIQEFGAGDLTMPPTNFENDPGVPVYPGSYSETEGTGEYAATGEWHFGGKTYSYIDPRMGLFNAREWIKDHAVSTAQGVIHL